MRPGRLELPRVSPQDPKSCAYANSATVAKSRKPLDTRRIYDRVVSVESVAHTGYCGVDVALAFRPFLFLGFEVQHVLHLLETAAFVLIVPNVVAREDRLGLDAHDIHGDVTGHASAF